MFLKKIRKLVAMALTIVVVGVSVPNNIYASNPSSPNKIQASHPSSKKLNKELNKYNQAIGMAAQKFEKYISLKENQYILSVPKNIIKNKKDREQFNLYSEYIDNMNKMIIENNVKNVTLEDGFTISISDARARDIAIENGLDIPADEEISTYAGISRFRWVTGGFDWWLTSFQAGIIIAGVGAGASYLCSLIPGVGWSAAASVASSMITFAVSNSVSRGVKVTYRFNKYLRITRQ